MKHSTLRGLLGVMTGTLTLLAAGQAQALGPSTTTSLRCLYKTNSTTTDPTSAYVWARVSSATSAYYKISGNWWQPKGPSVKNMFFTNTAQSTLKAACQNTFFQKGITQPLLMIAAADTDMGVNYTIWTNDPVTQPATISKVVVFGDSVSDNQNVYSTTQWEVPSPHSYVAGRFTNGKVWNEYLSDNLGVPNYNWAVGGAAADDYYVIPGVVSQVQSYLDYMPSAPNYKPANTLFTMLIGANDLINYGRTPDSIRTNEQSALQSLITSGAKNILVLNVPDLSKSPKMSAEMGFKTQTERDTLQGNVATLNTMVANMVATLKAQNPTVKIFLRDTRTLVDDMIAHPASYGVTNTTQSCLDINDDNSLNYAQTQGIRPGCTNADTYLFWDLLHPTTHSHKVIADQLVIPFVRANYPVAP
jgi:thermolabile hemolysin